MATNQYGLDTIYMRSKLKLLVRDADNYKPDEMARALARLVVVADADVLQESEFSAALRPEAGPVVIDLGKGDKLVADIYQDDEDGVIYKTGVGLFDPEPGKVYGIGVSDNRIDGSPITAARNPLALIWSDKPESLQVIIDELQEAINRLTGQQPAPRPVPTSERLQECEYGNAFPCNPACEQFGDCKPIARPAEVSNAD